MKCHIDIFVCIAMICKDAIFMENGVQSKLRQDKYIEIFDTKKLQTTPSQIPYLHPDNQ